MGLISGGGGGSGSGGVGSTSLIYRYTVAGVDKLNIDTGVDTPDAGSNVWTNGDVLEVYFYARTDEAIANSPVDLTLNNDTGTNYSRVSLNVASGSVTGGTAIGSASLSLTVAGASSTASWFSSLALTFPNYMSTAGFKTGQMLEGPLGSAVFAWNPQVYQYLSTSAISRLKFAVTTGGSKFKIGTQVSIYKRLAS